MSCPKVIKVVLPGPPGPIGTAQTIAANTVLGRGATSGVPVALPLGTGLSVVNGQLVVTGGGGGSGSVTSVAMTVPAGFAVSGSPITGAGTLAVSFAAGYSLPTTASQASWDAAAVLAGTAVQPAGLSSYVQTSDSRLSDSREWSAATATQADAEAGTSTTRLAFTPQRVFQAIAAWWAASTAKTKLDGIATGATANQTDAFLLSRANHTGTQAAATITGLATVATSGAYGDLSGRLVVSSSAPAALGATAAAGTSTDAARADHVHARSTYAELGAIGDGLILVVSNKGETATAGTNYVEWPVPVPSGSFTLVAVRFGCHIDNTGSSSTTLNAYRRTAAGVKTAMLTGNATLSAGASLVDASTLLVASPTFAAGDRIGVDLVGVGTGCQGIFAQFLITRSAT